MPTRVSGSMATRGRFAVAALILVAGCGSQADDPATEASAAASAATSSAASHDDGAAGGGGASGDICSAVTAADVEAATEQTVTATDAGETECSYTVNDTGLVSLRYESSFDPSLETARMICDDAEDVSGVGDEAIWCPGIGVLYFNDGDSSLAVQLVFIVEDPPRPLDEIATDLGELLAERL